MEHTYWLRQTESKHLYPDLEWSKPERRDQAGKLLIVGGNKLGFSAVAEGYQEALSAGIGQVKVILPDCLKSSVPRTLLDVIFTACTTSGGVSHDALVDLKASSEWSDSVLLIGDAGRNAETALVYEEFIAGYSGQLVVTRDAIDLVKNNPQLLVERDQTLVISSFAQLQKIFSGVYYPKVLTFSMQLLQLVEALHKFTITYPVAIMTFHSDTILIAQGGQVITQPWSDPMALWRGSIATKAAGYWLWNPSSTSAAVAASIVSK